MMQAGTYYVGDLCYVLHEKWDAVCDLIIQDNSCLDGEFNLPDGTRFAIQSTAYGDGSYQDNDGRGYSVDAGSIGCVKLSDIDLDVKENFLTGGQVIQFDHPFTVQYDDGKILFTEHSTFGEKIVTLAIETGDCDYDDYYDDSMDGDHDSAMASAGFGMDEDY